MMRLYSVQVVTRMRGIWERRTGNSTPSAGGAAGLTAREPRRTFGCRANRSRTAEGPLLLPLLFLLLVLFSWLAYGLWVLFASGDEAAEFPDIQAAWAEAVRHHRRNLRRYPDRYRLVRFEDLVREPDTLLPELCAFLGIEFELRVFGPHRRFRVQRFDTVPPGSSDLQPPTW